MKKKIGFVDLYISEWHANNYPAWIGAAAERLGLSYELAYAYAEQNISPVDGRSTDEWCNTFGAKKCDTIDELCKKSDAIIVLAPSNPEVHLRLAKAVLKYKKPTYIDKTFAPDYKTAQEIYAIGEEYGTPFFSSSALRYASELEAIKDARDLMLTGGGSNFPEYAVHQIEMLVKVLGTDAKSVRAETFGTRLQLSVCFESGKTGTMIYAPDMGFTLYAKGESKSHHREITSDFFPSLIEAILLFFESGTLPFDKKETLAAMRLREGALLAAQDIGRTVFLDVLT